MTNWLSLIDTLDYSGFANTLGKILKNQSSFNPFHQRTFQFPSPATQAAVLVPFLKIDREWHLLFIHRAEDQHIHSGQVAFPGGKI
ncbi:MAG: hypothetical protein ACPL0B_02980, partial [Anaerolineales bacterium]